MMNESDSFRIKVGYTYRTRKGELVDIINKNYFSKLYKFQDSNGRWYIDNGQVLTTDKTPDDLLEELGPSLDSEGL